MKFDNVQNALECKNLRGGSNVTRGKSYPMHVFIMGSLCLSLFLAACNSLEKNSTVSTNKQLENMSVQFVKALFDGNQKILNELTIEQISFGVMVNVGRDSKIERADIRQKELSKEGDKYKSVLEVNFKDYNENSRVFCNIFFSQVDGKWKISDFKLQSTE